MLELRWPELCCLARGAPDTPDGAAELLKVQEEERKAKRERELHERRVKT